MRYWILALALSAPMANAALITIEPDDFEAGEQVTDPYPGVHIQHNFRLYGGERDYRPVTIVEHVGCPGVQCAAMTGTRTFGSYGDHYAYHSEEHAELGSIYNVLEISFDMAVYDFTVYLTFGADYPVVGGCITDNRGNAYQGSCTAHVEPVVVGGIEEFYRAAITIPGRVYGPIDIAGMSGYSTVDAFSFRTEPFVADVPTPSTLALMGLGLAGLVTLRRKT